MAVPPNDKEGDQKTPKSSTEETAITNSVGYGRPPTHTRFKKGRSGNPRGRPKGARKLSTVLNEALQKKVAVRNGRAPMRAKDILVQNLLAAALMNDLKAVDRLLRLAEKCGELDPDQEAAPARQLTADDKKLISDFAERIKESHKATQGNTDVPDDPNEDQ